MKSQCLGPVLHGRYPEHAPQDLLPPAALIADGDLDVIRAPLDFLGVNYYSPIFLRAGDPADLRRNENPARCQLPGVVEYLPDDLERTPMGWLVDPSGLHQILVEVSRQAPGLPLFVTENGCAAEDYVNPDGEVNDVERVRYLHTHLEAAARAIKDGASLAGVLRLVAAGQLRVGLGLPEAVRDRVRGLRHAAQDPQGQRRVLRERGPGQRDPAAAR